MLNEGFGILGFLILVVFAVPMLAYIAFSARIWMRYKYREFRGQETGKMLWVRLSQQQRNVQQDRTGRGITELANNATKSFTNGLNMDGWSKRARVARPIASFVWVRDTEGQVTLYAGVTAKYKESLKAYVRSLGYNMQQVKRPPVPDGELVVAFRSRMEDVTRAEETPIALGTVASSLSGASIPEGRNAAIIMTIEPSRISEATRYERNLAESKLMRQGDSGAGSAMTTSHPASVASQNLMRASIGAIVEQSALSHSISLLKLTTSSMTGLVSRPSGRSITRNQSRLGVWMGGAGLAIAALLVVFGGATGLVSGLLIGAVAILGLVLNGTQRGASAVKRYRRNGEIVVPNYFYTSPRYFFLSRYYARRTNGAGGERVGNRIAPPSTPQVISLYATPLTSFTTTPETSNQSLDVSSESVPDLPLPQKMLNFTDDDVPLALTYYRRQMAVLPLSTLQLSMAVFGAPSSGKTNFLHTVWTSVCMLGYMRSGGLNINPIWVETKGAGAYDAYRYAYSVWESLYQRGQVSAEKEPLLIDAHNPNSPYRLVMEGRNVRLSPETPIEDIIADIDRFEQSVEYGFGEKAVSHRSSEFMRERFRLTSLLTAEEIDLLVNQSTDAHDSTPLNHLDSTYPHVMKFAWILLRGDSTIPIDKRITSLSDAHSATLREVQSGKRSLPDIEVDRLKAVISSVRVLGPLYHNDRDAVSNVGAPRNKLSKFIQAKAVFESDGRREHITPEQLVHMERPVILNFGPYEVEKNGVYTDQTKRVLDDANSRLLAIFCNYIIWSYVKNVGSSWGNTGKRVPTFADEVADLASDSPDSGNNYFADALKEGRSRGISYFVAAQSPQQIPESANQAVMGIRNKIFFQLPNNTDGEIAVGALASQDTGEVTVRHLTDLPTGVAVGRIYDGSMSPPLSLTTPDAQKWVDWITHSSNPVEAMYRYQESIGGPTRNGLFDDEDGIDEEDHSAPHPRQSRTIDPDW